MAPDEKPPKSSTTTAEDNRGDTNRTDRGGKSSNGHANRTSSSPTTPTPTPSLSPSPEPPPPPHPPSPHPLNQKASNNTSNTVPSGEATTTTSSSTKINGAITTSTSSDVGQLQQQQQEVRQRQKHQQQQEKQQQQQHEKEQKQKQKQQQKQEKERERHGSGTSDVSTESYENYIPSPPDGGWGWVIVVASLFCNIIVDGLGYSFGVFLLEFADYFQESKSKVSLVGSLLCGVYLFAGPVVSAMTNKLGCRPVAVAGSVVASVAFLLSTMAPTVDILILTYGVMGGFGLGMIYLPSIVSVGYYFESKRALATGIAVCGSGIGTFIFAPLSEFLLQELDWKNALMIISGITLNGAVCGMLMRPLEPGRPKHRPRSKNLLDRIKEQATGTRNWTSSENGLNASTVHDTNAVLERVMEAKLLREKRLQEDESELGSLPSIFLVRQQSHKDSKDLRVHKLSLSDKGDVTSCGHLEDSPLGSMPRISSSMAPTSLPILVEASHQNGKPVVVVDSPPPAAVSPTTTTSSTTAPITAARTSSTSHLKEDQQQPPTINVEDSSRYDITTEGSNSTEDKTIRSRSPDAGVGSPGRADEEMSASDTFVDAESGTFGDGTNTERSDYVTPPTSPPDTCSPTTPEREREEQGGTGTTRAVLPDSAKNGLVKRTSDPAVSKFLARSGKELKNGSVPSNIHHHVHEVVPLLQVPDRKTTVVNLGSEKNMWRLKHVHTPVGACGQSLVSLSVSKKDLARPLYRKDIFYSGSVQNLPLFRSQPDMKSYITSITTIPGETVLVAGGEAKVWRYLQCFPQSCKDTLQEMLDVSLLKDPGFLLICLGNVMAFLGFYVPFVYCVDHAVSLNIDKSKAAFLISIIGITNTLGRVMTGWLADLRRINSLVITYVSMFICGLSTAVFPFCESYGLLCAAASVFGLSVAAFISLSSILICDLLGLDKLTNGFGLLSLFRGMAAMAGPPLAGFMYDQTISYDASFFLGGALLIVGALCHLALRLPCVHKSEAPVLVTTVSVEELPQAGMGSGVKPEFVTLEEVMTSV